MGVVLMSKRELNRIDVLARLDAGLPAGLPAADPSVVEAISRWRRGCDCEPAAWSKARSCRRLEAGVTQASSLIRLHLTSSYLVMNGSSQRVNCPFLHNLFVRVLALRKFHFSFVVTALGRSPSKQRSNPGALQSTGITSTSKPPQWSI